MLTKLRYPLLAGTMLAAVALPQWGIANTLRDWTGQERIILAEVVDPKKKKDQPKQPPAAPKQPPAAAPQPKQVPATAPQPKQPPQVQPQPRQLPPAPPPPRTVQPQDRLPPPGAPKQPLSVQPQPKQLPKAVQPQPKQLPKAVQPQPDRLPPPVQPKQLPQGIVSPGQPPGQPKQFGKQPPGDLAVQPRQLGQPPQGQVPAVPQGIVPRQAVRTGAPDVSNVDQLRAQRRQRAGPGGQIVIEEPGRRFIVRDGGRTFIRQDETERFRRWGTPRLEMRGAERYTIVRRPGGVDIITVTDANGRFLRRIRRGPDRREVILIDNRPRIPGAVIVGAGVLGAAVIVGLVAPRIMIPRERYIVSSSEATLLYETLDAPPVEPLERAYSLDEIRYNVVLRDRMRRVDIDTINFATGSWEVTPDQAPALAAIAQAIMQVIANNPDQVLMIEGHTDAVGTDEDNLSLSDRRAESVASILTETYQVPPENLVTQGYGEQHLKVPTDGPSRENRRVTVRNIGPLLTGNVAQPPPQ